MHSCLAYWVEEDTILWPCTNSLKKKKNAQTENNICLDSGIRLMVIVPMGTPNEKRLDCVFLDRLALKPLT